MEYNDQNNKKELKELNKKILELKGTVDPVQIQKLQQKIDILIKKQNKNENKT
jgi:hypothetical protein|tara:strand:- start:4589 stop:4747 length:159 start_codon:yes stop_codon:yes gene_type:complete